MSRPQTPASPAYLRVVRASAWYDLAVTAGFATPWTYALVHDALSSCGNALGLGALPELDPWQILFANLMGSVVVVWAVLRIVGPLPETDCSTASRVPCSWRGRRTRWPTVCRGSCGSSSSSR